MIAQLPAEVVGRRHEREDGRDCFCGCHEVPGLSGIVVQDSDTDKLLSLDRPMLVAEFEVPCAAGGPARTTGVAYYVDELGSAA